MAFTTGNRARRFVLFGDLSMTTCAHAVISLLQCSLCWVQIRLESKAGLMLMARGALYAFSIFFQFSLIHDVLTIFETVMALAAFDTGIIKVSQMRKFNRRPAPTGKYRLVIQQNVFWLSA
jgi:hypothetical protein